MDLSKLSSAPWAYHCSPDCTYPHSVFGATSIDGSSTSVAHSYWTHEHAAVDMEFCALARNAFQVMLERGWFPAKCPNGWCAAELCDQYGSVWTWAGMSSGKPCPIEPTPDPFTCLVEADRWYKENVEMAGS